MGKYHNTPRGLICSSGKNKKYEDNEYNTIKQTDGTPTEVIHQSRNFLMSHFMKLDGTL